jgi:hypothetical protein
MVCPFLVATDNAHTFIIYKLTAGASFQTLETGFQGLENQVRRVLEVTMHKHLIVLTSLLLLTGCAMFSGNEAFAPEFFAFYNGVDFGLPDNEAQTLKELDYDGISQIQVKQGDELTSRIAAYDQAGLKILSVYLNVHDTPLDPEVFQPLTNRGAMLELTVRKMTPTTVEAIRQTVESAAQMDIRVVLYPHYRFAVDTMPKALELVEKVNHPNLGVMFNLCHFLKCENADDLELILEQAALRLFSVSTSGGDEGGRDWSELIQTLDKGNFPQVRLFSKLKELNYKGPVCLQCYKVPGDKRANLKTSRTAWQEILSELQ